MSNLYVANLYLETTSNNGIIYATPNSIQIIAGGVLSSTINATGQYYATAVNAVSFTTTVFTANATTLATGPMTVNSTVLSSGALTVNSTAVVTTTNTFNLGTSNLTGTGVGSNGYSYLPNGLLLMWGLASGNTAGSPYTFLSTCGKSFPVNCLSMQVSTAGVSQNIGVQALNSTSFTLYSGNNSGKNMYFMAIGY